jgi:hypothetical protein
VMLLEGAGFVNHAFCNEPDLIVCVSGSLGRCFCRIKSVSINNDRGAGILQCKNIYKKIPLKNRRKIRFNAREIK